MNLQTILDLLSRKETLISLAVLLGIAVLLLIMRRFRVNRMKRKLKDLEIKYNNVRSVPLPFKLNKAVALARVNKEVNDQVTNSKSAFDQVQNNLKQIAQLLAETEDLILMGKIKPAQLNLADLGSMIERGESQVSALESALDLVLEEEAQQRTQITELKENFRALKQAILTRGSQLQLAEEVLNQKLTDIEKGFTAFEEWMYASEFGKAKEKMEEIALSLDENKQLVEQLPELIMLAKGVIPKQMEEVSQLYNRLKQKGVYVQHLEVVKNLEMVSETSKEDLTNLRRAAIANVSEHLHENQKRLEQLMAQMDREDKAFDEVDSASKMLTKSTQECSEMQETLKQSHQKASVRFGWDDLKGLLVSSAEKLTIFNETQARLHKMISERSIPATTLLISVKESQQDVSNLAVDLQNALNRLNAARGDEERAKKQLLKLHLIMNEIQVKIRKHNLPSISDGYEGDMRKSYQYINSIGTLLNDTPLDVNLLNATLTDAIDHIYKLYNNVNNIVGTVDMVENAIVFANKYRSSNPEMDNQLTRAELCFHNGDYTQAIKIAIAAIEKVHPVSYEKLIKENSQSANV